MTFPCDDYTPFGYLANPFHRATSWSATEAGLLKSFDDAVGFGWVEPTARKPAFELGLALAIRWQDRLYQTRSDFARLGLHSRHHSSRLFSYDFALDDVSAALSFALAGRDALVGRLAFAHPAGLPRAFEVILLARLAGDRAASAWHVQSIEGGWLFRDGASGRDFVFAIDGTVGQPLSPRELARLAPDLLSASRVAAGLRIQGSLNVGDTWSVSAALLRDTRDATAAHRIAAAAPSVIAERREEDDAFYAETALPMGDWPSEWKRGWVYDLETTRACIYPAGGVFHDEWPSWMIPWPRVVVAEGCLDANRFGYAAPKRALRLARTIFVDATAANVPCVFQGGEPNMVAKDGAICGTSPAWCLPFYNLWLLYARTGDHAWLGELIPHLEAYLDFWLRERTDEEGWIVYKCTWEAGEDCTPRLDPAEEGDEVVSRFVRPVELQATFSQSARILSRFAGEVGDDARAQHWDAIAADYARRTQTLWDDVAGRYRDWDKRAGAFLQSRKSDPASPDASVAGLYWQTDPIRYSALSLTPLVAGLADEGQRQRLRAEIERYDVAPWCLWPSWSFVVAEAASVSGWYDFAGRYAARIIDRVYRANDRRTLAEAPRPTPGTAPEFWPLDLTDFNGSDGYGWGATTTSLWLRQIFGFREGDSLDEFSFTLAPSLPANFLQPGRRYGFRGLPYRGSRLDLVYEVAGDELEVIARATPARQFQAIGAGSEVTARWHADTGETRFRVGNGEAVRVVGVT